MTNNRRFRRIVADMDKVSTKARKILSPAANTGAQPSGYTQQGRSPNGGYNASRSAGTSD
ncbi:MAG: hypothetical protein IPQ14_10705, partial [Candidatus Microthrix sp.]|nr:hypothetical protein [Candidatus Microthrix sp.]